MRFGTLFAVCLFIQPAQAQERLTGSVVESFVANPPVSSGGLLVGAMIAETSPATVPLSFDALLLPVPGTDTALPGCLYATTRDGRYSAESGALGVVPGPADIVPLALDGFGSVAADTGFPAYPQAEFAAVIRLGGPCSGPEIAPVYPVVWQGAPREALHIALNAGGASVRSIVLMAGDQVIEGSCGADPGARSVGFDHLCTVALPSPDAAADCARLTIRYRPRGVFRAETEDYDIAIAVPPTTACLRAP